MLYQKTGDKYLEWRICLDFALFEQGIRYMEMPVNFGLNIYKLIFCGWEMIIGFYLVVMLYKVIYLTL